VFVGNIPLLLWQWGRAQALPRLGLLEQPLIGKREVSLGPIADDHMVEHTDAEQLASLHQAHGQGAVFLRRLRRPARVVIAADNRGGVAQDGGLYWDHKKGIALGSPLSPILGAFFSTEVDDAMEQLELFYVRYMDDLLVLTPTRWKLRQAVKIVNRSLTALQLTKHPDKTFIGRIEKGFDFLRYRFGPEGLHVAPKTLMNFVARVHQLYEQELRMDIATRLGAYKRRWVRWVTTGIPLAALRLLPNAHGGGPVAAPMAAVRAILGLRWRAALHQKAYFSTDFSASRDSALKVGSIFNS